MTVTPSTFHAAMDNIGSYGWLLSGGDLEMNEMNIHFSNGQSYRPNVRHRFSNEGPPLIIDLPGDIRNVTRIEYNYRSTNKREGKARVIVYGR